MRLTCRRIYGDERQGAEYRVFVDRLWPRGVSKEDADLDQWAKDLTPSSGLRSWFHENKDDRYDEFARRYRAELKETDFDFSELRKHTSIVLLTAVKDVETSHIPTLTKYLKKALT